MWTSAWHGNICHGRRGAGVCCAGCETASVQQTGLPLPTGSTADSRPRLRVDAGVWPVDIVSFSLSLFLSFSFQLFWPHSSAALEHRQGSGTLHNSSDF
ncbi:hypothetical protein VTK73DRAFT_2639 [Phialemonium thermophilum]|uniref:Uncharacterized protein n=1 Tax=Phialemonium thermophilum TaxID=223376 RepID=A0ABR3VQH8_9PEZI